MQAVKNFFGFGPISEYPNVDKYKTTVDVDDEKFQENVTELLKEYGVVIIPNILSAEESAQKVQKLLSEFESAFPVSLDDMSTWNGANIPHGPKEGLFHSLVGQLPTVWECRTNERVLTAFRKLYSGLRGREIKELCSSQDGINLRPRKKMTLYHDPNRSDWAHLDQTIRYPFQIGSTDELCPDIRHACIQGQLVLSESTGCFRCSPGSHKLYFEVLDLLQVDPENDDNWLPFNDSYQPLLEKMVEGQGGEWQVNFKVPPGSLILWSGSTIHSAKLQDPPSSNDPLDDLLNDLRVVIYTCHRPQEDLDDKHFELALSAYQKCSTTNHWGEFEFSQYPMGFKINKERYHKDMIELYDNPKLLRTKPNNQIPKELEEKIMKLLTRQ